MCLVNIFNYPHAWTATRTVLLHSKATFRQYIVELRQPLHTLFKIHKLQIGDDVLSAANVSESIWVLISSSTTYTTMNVDESKKGQEIQYSFRRAHIFKHPPPLGRIVKEGPYTMSKVSKVSSSRVSPAIKLLPYACLKLYLYRYLSISETNLSSSPCCKFSNYQRPGNVPRKFKI